MLHIVMLNVVAPKICQEQMLQPVASLSEKKKKLNIVARLKTKCFANRFAKETKS
jgi:hypothetical protein